MSTKPKYQLLAEAVRSIVKRKGAVSGLHAKDLLNEPEIKNLPFITGMNSLTMKLADAHKVGALRRVNRVEGGQRFAYLPPETANEPLPFNTPPLPYEIERERGEPLPAPTGIEALARTIGASIAAVMVGAMKAEFERQLSGVGEWAQEVVAKAGVIHKPEAPESRNRLPCVLVAGLLPAQAGMIQNEFGEVLKLRFADASASLQQLKDSARGVDAAFTFTGKISHGVEEAIQATGTPLHRVSGGMSSLRDRLTRFVVNEEYTA
jgi:hypothetical protein